MTLYYRIQDNGTVSKGCNTSELEGTGLSFMLPTYSRERRTFSPMQMMFSDWWTWQEKEYMLSKEKGRLDKKIEVFLNRPSLFEGEYDAEMAFYLDHYGLWSDKEKNEFFEKLREKIILASPEQRAIILKKFTGQKVLRWWWDSNKNEWGASYVPPFAESVCEWGDGGFCFQPPDAPKVKLFYDKGGNLVHKQEITYDRNKRPTEIKQENYKDGKKTTVVLWNKEENGSLLEGDGPYSRLPAPGSITQEQKNAIIKRFQEKLVSESNPDKRVEILNILVQEGFAKSTKSGYQVSMLPYPPLETNRYYDNSGNLTQINDYEYSGGVNISCIAHMYSEGEEKRRFVYTKKNPKTGNFCDPQEMMLPTSSSISSGGDSPPSVPVPDGESEAMLNRSSEASSSSDAGTTDPGSKSESPAASESTPAAPASGSSTVSETLRKLQELEQQYKKHLEKPKSSSVVFIQGDRRVV